jgi:exodeoxyribonuclease V alpha subunit
MPVLTLTESQEKAVTLIQNSRFSLLTGGGGTGKTTLLAEYIKRTPGVPTFCFAPTGKAAQRMMEAFSECGVDLRAKTIHSGLIPTRVGYDGLGWQFEYNSDNYLPADRVFVDETSMLAGAETSWLFAAIRPGCQVVMIGDDYQLSPVGKGKPLKDMIESKAFPHAHLTEVHRYAGRIAHVCKSVRLGKKIEPSPKLDLEPDASQDGPENYRHLERFRGPQILETMDLMLKRMEDRGFDPIKDVQVIVTRNKAGDLNRNTVNHRLQELLNPNGHRIPKCLFRVGDKVICKKNKHRVTWHTLDGIRMEKDHGQTYVANGEDGIVVHLEEKAIFVHHAGGVVKYTKPGWEKEVVLGYALTCHSTQGSGWPVAIYLVDDCTLNDRNLVYTGFSRPKKILLSIGQLGVLNRQILKSKLDDRKTFLSELYTGAIQ